jgi:cellulose synthase/poly-beta-1,6-N-acetylglucosamine synthase-like glycosyltransferase
MWTIIAGVLLLVPSSVTIAWHVICWLAGKRFRSAPETAFDEVTVSVLVPTRNDPPELLERVVESVSLLSWPKDKLELIVVSDDPGQRGLLLKKLVESKSSELGLDSKVIVRDSPVGKRCGALNEAFRVSRGEYIMLLDMDNKPHPLTLRSAAAYLSKGYAACVPRWSSYSYRETRVSTTVAASTDFLSDSIFKGRAALGLFIFPVSGVVYKRQVLESLGLWDLKVVQDDMWMGVKLISNGMKVAFSDGTPVEVLVPHTYKAFKIQQSKWFYGVMDVLRRGTPKVLKSKSAPFVQRLEALFYLCQQVPPCCVLLGTFLLSAVALSTSKDVALTLLPALAAWWVFNFVEASTFLKSQLDRGKNVWDSLFALGRSAAMAFALAPSLLISGLTGLTGIRMGYKITPKGEEEKTEAGVRDVTGEALALTSLLALTVALIIRGAFVTASVVVCAAIPFAYVFIRLLR